jgi:hypothetical protein
MRLLIYNGTMVDMRRKVGTSHRLTLYVKRMCFGVEDPKVLG